MSEDTHHGKPRFDKILASRSNQTPPSELEVCLRQHCQCLKVAARPLNGAHLLVLPATTGEATMAVRVYNHNDVLWKSQNNTVGSAVSSSMHRRNNNNNHDKENDDLDGLAKFQKSFALTLVFFILTTEQKVAQLADRQSFVRRAQHLLTTPNVLMTGRPNESKKKTTTTTRLFFVATSEAAVQALKLVANGMTPNKRQLQQSWYQSQQRQHYVPPMTTNSTGSANYAATTPDQARVAALHVQRALQKWADRNHIPRREIQAVCDTYGSLEVLVDQTAQGCPGLSPHVVSSRTRQILEYFFRGTNSAVWLALRDPLRQCGGGGGTGGTSTGSANPQMHPPSYYHSQTPTYPPPSTTSHGYRPSQQRPPQQLLAPQDTEWDSALAPPQPPPGLAFELLATEEDSSSNPWGGSNAYMTPTQNEESMAYRRHRLAPSRPQDYVPSHMMPRWNTYSEPQNSRAYVTPPHVNDTVYNSGQFQDPAAYHPHQYPPSYSGTTTNNNRPPGGRSIQNLPAPRAPYPHHLPQRPPLSQPSHRRPLF